MEKDLARGITHGELGIEDLRKHKIVSKGTSRYDEGDGNYDLTKRSL